MTTYEEQRALDREGTRRAMAERDEAALKLERNAGRLDQIYEGLRHDPEHVALMRGLAWTRTGRTFSLKDGKPVSPARSLVGTEPYEQSGRERAYNSYPV